MRNLIDYPITPDEVIRVLNDAIKLEEVVESLQPVGSIDGVALKVAIAVVKAASTIVQNDIGSTAAELLEKAFRSQDIPVRETA